MRSQIPWLVVALTAVTGCRGCGHEPPAVSDASTTTLGPPSASAVVMPLPKYSGPSRTTPLPDGKHCLAGSPTEPSDTYDHDHPNAVKSHDGLAWVWAEDEPYDADSYERPKGWLCFERNGKRKVLLSSRESDAGVEHELNDFTDFVWSRDDRNVFFSTSAWAVSGAAHGVEVATGKEFFITDGSIIIELDRGPYKGSLYATHFRLDEDHPFDSPLYSGRGVVSDIIDWHGKRLAKVPGDGEDPKERRRILGE